MIAKKDYGKDYYEPALGTEPSAGGYSEFKRSVVFHYISEIDAKRLGVGKLDATRWASWRFYKKYITRFRGAKVLELGCAKGFLVEDFRSFGVNIIGIDFSVYINNAATSNTQHHISYGDARVDLSKYQDNEFDVIVGLRFLPCIADVDLINLMDEIKRISRVQIHTVDDLEFYQLHSDKFNAVAMTNIHNSYNIKTLAEWREITGEDSIVTSIGDEIWEEIR